MTQLPRAIMFMQAGFDLAVYLEVEKRWPAYSEDERQQDEFAFRLNEGNVKHHTLTRLQSLVGAVKGKRLTYKALIA